MADLEALGVRFDSDRTGALALGLEGGHSRRRVVHAGGSSTGRRVTRELSALAATNEQIEVLEPFAAGALWCHEGRCVGLAAVGRGGTARAVSREGVLLATGGAAALWSRTTNPPGAAGTGLSLALAAGAALADLEFTQFHPTALVTGGRREGFLVTEAIRGEGAVLIDANGERFVDELAPRDQVAMGVQARMREQGTDSVGLDVSSVDLARFPNVAAALDDVGLDPRRPLPVAPAAHYTMGGVAADLDGRSTLPGLFAVGESACTGLHGANRLASNSLAECFVFGRRAALAALEEPAPAAGGRPAGRRRRPRCRVARRGRRSGGWPAWSATTRACASCSTIPSRSPARWPPRVWPDRKAGEHTSAATTRRPTPRSTGATPWCARAPRRGSNTGRERSSAARVGGGARERPLPRGDGLTGLGGDGDNRPPPRR